jgi:rod shape-determining protein MreC
MLDFIFNHKRGLTTFALLIVSVMLIGLTETKVGVSAGKIGFSIIYPFQYIFNSTGKGVNSVVNAVAERNKLEKQLNLAMIELVQYRKMLIDFNVIIKENSDLRNTLELRDSFNYKSLTAQIVGRDPANMFDYLIIDKGSNHGIRENMAVISYKNGRKALVGKIFAVTPFASKVMTLKNPDLQVGVVIDYNGTHCMVQGQRTANQDVRLLYVPKDFTLEEGRSPLVYTSGDSFFYSKGIEIGTISEIVPSKRFEIYNEARVTMSEDYSKLEYVLVLMLDVDKDNFKSLENPF